MTLKHHKWWHYARRAKYTSISMHKATFSGSKYGASEFKVMLVLVLDHCVTHLITISNTLMPQTLMNPREHQVSRDDTMIKLLAIGVTHHMLRTRVANDTCHTYDTKHHKWCTLSIRLFACNKVVFLGSKYGAFMVLVMDHCVTHLKTIPNTFMPQTSKNPRER